MEFQFPYRFIVDSPAQADYMLKNMCDNCSRFYICSDFDAARCDEIRRTIAEEYGRKEVSCLNIA